MKNKKLAVTVGIPAYNEEANINLLLKNLLAQKLSNEFILKEILIVSDGSTDKTAQIAKSFSSPLVKVFEKKTRKGQQVRQNELVSLFKGHILVIIEADTLPFNDKTLFNLVRPFAEAKAEKLGMTVGKTYYESAETLIGKIESHGNNLKDRFFEGWRNGDNVYMSGGHSMKALSKSFASNLKWPSSVPEDSYTYLRLKQLGLVMKRVAKARVYAKSSQNVNDAIGRNKKFLSGKVALKKYFPEEQIAKEFNHPKNLFLRHMATNLIQSPLLTSAFVAKTLIIRILNSNVKQYNPLYPPFSSTKNLYKYEK